MITLGGISLSDHLILGGIETAPDLAYSQRRLIGGASYVQTDAIIGGRELTLSGENHFTLAEITAVKALAAAMQPVTLVHHRGTFTVLIVAVEATPTFAHADPDDDSWYSGSINMIEV